MNKKNRIYLRSVSDIENNWIENNKTQKTNYGKFAFDVFKVTVVTLTNGISSIGKKILDLVSSGNAIIDTADYIVKPEPTPWV